jgi:hypothetical protein
LTKTSYSSKGLHFGKYGGRGNVSRCHMGDMKKQKMTSCISYKIQERGESEENYKRKSKIVALKSMRRTK